MKYRELATPGSSVPVRRRSVRIAMANEEALDSGSHALSADDTMDEIPLIKRMEKVKEAQRVDKGGLLDGRINTYCNVNEVARQVRAKLTQEEINRFRSSPFGSILDVLECPWISGQLLIHLVGNCVRSANGGGRKDDLKFKILGHEVVLTKAQFHLITGLKMGGLRGQMDNGVSGRFASRYFRGSKAVKRREISNAFLKFDRDVAGTMPNDALKMSLIYMLANAFLGNQPSVNLPMSYLNLVDDLDEFDRYPWGDDVWSELVDHVYRCAVCIEKGGSTRPTFGGYMFALQVWAFETFPSLAEAGMCVLDPGRVNSIPCCLRWKVCAKFNAAKVSEALFKSGKLQVTVVEPTDAEMLLESVKEMFKEKISSTVKGKGKLSLSASKRVRAVKEKQVNIREALGKMKSEGVAPGNGDVKLEGGSGIEGYNLGGRSGKRDCVGSKACDHLRLVDEIKDIKEKQAAQDKKLDEILGILRQKTASLEGGSASGKGSLMEGSEEVKVQEGGFGSGGNTKVGVKCGDDIELSFDAGGPSFDLLTPMPKVDAVCDDVQDDIIAKASLVEEACDAEKQSKCLDIPYTETQYDPLELDRINRVAERALNCIHNARSVPKDSCVGVESNVEDDGKCKETDGGDDSGMKRGDCTMPTDGQVTLDVNAAVGGSSGSNRLKVVQHVPGCEERVNMGDDDFDRIFTISRVGSVGQKEMGDQHPVAAGSLASTSNNACVEIERPKRVHKNPERYTPSEAEQDRKRRKLEKTDHDRQCLNRERTAVCYGPFSEDPKKMPAAEEIEKVRQFLNEGLLKRHGRGNTTCRYTSKVENMKKNPIDLDGFKVESKTWLYELFTSTEWLRSTHIEIAMHFLEVKGRQYDLIQMYTTTTPFFLQGLHTHQELVNVGKAKKEEVISNRNLTSEVKGLVRKYSRPWVECDFVYMPLSIGDHWVLLVLEVEGRTIRVYDSKGRKGNACRSLSEYMQCLTELLPVLVDLLGVYKEHSDGLMGKRKFSISVVDGCPQQDDGFSCGMFMLKFAEYLMMDGNISEVHSRDMKGYREKMTTELIAYSNEQKVRAGDS